MFEKQWRRAVPARFLIFDLRRNVREPLRETAGLLGA
jgi:hypothetical protein